MRLSFDVQMTGLRNMENRTVEQAKTVLWLSMHKMEELAKAKCPVDTGTLRRSINLHPNFKGAKKYVLADGVTYGEDIEYGNTPRYVALKPLIQWVERKGIRSGQNAYLFAKYVQEKIKKEGVNAQPFMRPAKLEVQTVWLKLYWTKVMAVT